MKTVPDSTKLRLMKGPKSKFPGGTCPQTSLVRHMLCTQICTCPPIIHTISFCPPPLGQKAERKPAHYQDFSRNSPLKVGDVLVVALRANLDDLRQNLITITCKQKFKKIKINSLFARATYIYEYLMQLLNVNLSFNRSSVLQENCIKICHIGFKTQSWKISDAATQCES